MPEQVHPPSPGSNTNGTCQRKTDGPVRPNAAAEGQREDEGEQACSHETWIPDPMSLALLAAQLHPQDCRSSGPEQALQHAWALFVQSKAFCAELRQKSLAELSHFYGTTPGCSHTSRVTQSFYKSAPPSKTLRFYPDGAEADEVSRFLDAKRPRTVLTRIRKYCDANGDEDGGSPYDMVLQNAVRTGKNGELYYELPIDLLSEIKKREKQVKRDGGTKSRRPPSRLLREVVPDTESGPFDVRGDKPALT